MIQIYREPSSKITSASWKTIILDRGNLKKAIKDSKGQYLFSEVGAGIQPLVLVGTLAEIVEFCYENKDITISNQISDLPEIYVGVSKYVHKKRYDGTFPLHQITKALINNILNYVPSNEIVDALSGSVSFIQSLKNIITGNKKKKENKLSDVLYLKIFYINDFENSSKKVGIKKTTFATILNYLLNIKETSV